jgi:hypothetical protein
VSDDREVALSGEYVRESTKAYCIKIDGRDLWVPKSVVTDITEDLVPGESIDVFVKPWFAEKEGLA